MRKANSGTRFFVLTGVCIALMTMAGAVAAGTIDHGFTGVTAEAQGMYVDSILQLTDNPYKDAVQCWGAQPWSSDGEWIVYQSQIVGTNDTDNEICKIKPDGTGYARLTTNDVCDSHPAFVPDGRIVFQRKVDNVPELWIMNADGTGQTSLTQSHGGPVSGGEETHPMVSPDGTKIAFKTCSKDIWVMNIDGSNPVKVSGTLSECTKHTWSPDSQWILFNSKVSYTTNEASRIYKVRPDGSDLTMLSADTDDPTCENWAFWSPDGNWIAYHTNDNNPAGYDLETHTLSIMRPDGTGKTALVTETEEAAAADWDTVCGPKAWSPDSKWIAFKQSDDDTSSTTSSIHLINIDTLATVQLTENYYDGRLWWSPSGKHILFREPDRVIISTNNRDGDLYDRDLLVMNIAANAFQNAAQMLFTQVVSEAAPGSTVRLTAYIKNTGEAAFTPDVSVRFYVNGSPAGDSQCVSILPDRYLWNYYQWTVPADFSGEAAVTAQVFDAGGAISEVSTAATLTVPSPVYTVDILRFYPVPSTAAGGRVLLKVLVKNSGTTALAAGTHVDFYMEGPDYGTPTSVGTVTAAGLAAGACRWYYMYWPLPAGITGGTYTLSAQVKDSGGTAVSDVSTGFSFAVSGS